MIGWIRFLEGLARLVFLLGLVLDKKIAEKNKKGLTPGTKIDKPESDESKTVPNEPEKQTPKEEETTE